MLWLTLICVGALAVIMVANLIYAKGFVDGVAAAVSMYQQVLRRLGLADEHEKEAANGN